MSNNKTITIEEFEELRECNVGICIEPTCCGERDCCEPDAEGYECPECGQDTIHGAETLLFLGLVN